MPLNYSPSSTAVSAVINGTQINIAVFPDGEKVIFGVWEMTEAGPWRPFGGDAEAACMWSLPYEGVGQLTLPGDEPENLTLAQAVTGYGDALIDSFIGDAETPGTINHLFAELVSVTETPPDDPPPVPDVAALVATLRARLAGLAVDQQQGEAPVVTRS